MFHETILTISEVGESLNVMGPGFRAAVKWPCP